MDPADAGDTPLYPVGPAHLALYAGRAGPGGRTDLYRLRHTPGHTPGSWLLAVRTFLFCGDTLFAGSVAAPTLPGATPPPKGPALQRSGPCLCRRKPGCCLARPLSTLGRKGHKPLILHCKERVCRS